jgi:hypothetical protein
LRDDLAPAYRFTPVQLTKVDQQSRDKFLNATIERVAVGAPEQPLFQVALVPGQSTSEAIPVVQRSAAFNPRAWHYNFAKQHGDGGHPDRKHVCRWKCI